MVTEPDLAKEILTNREGTYPKTKSEGNLRNYLEMGSWWQKVRNGWGSGDWLIMLSMECLKVIEIFWKFLDHLSSRMP